MKKRYFLFLILPMLFLLFTLPIFAESGIQVARDRFSCESLFSESASLFSQSDGTAILSFRNGAPTVSLENADFSEASEANAIRVVLKNNSTCNVLELSYSTNGIFQEERIPISRRSGKSEYFVYVSGAQDISDVKLSFSGAYSGTVELFSVGAVSIYNDSSNQPGEILDCVYDESAQKVRISGTVDHEIAVGTRNCTIALYTFIMDEVVSEVKINRASPIASAALSMRFEFEVPATTFMDRFLQYVVAVIDETGRVVYYYSPRVPCVSHTGSQEQMPPFKGVYTEYSVLASYADAGVAIVDVYLDHLNSDKNDGFVYALDGSYFYIDREYISELDELIRQYSTFGMRVYLRLLLDGDGQYNVLHGNVERTEGVENYGLSIRGDVARMTLYSCVEFLCSRYAEGATGCVDGIVLGRSVDEAALYNFTGHQNLETYTKVYGTALYIVSQAANASGRDLDIVVPITDRYDSGVVVKEQTGRYLPGLLLTSLCKYADSCFGSAFSFRVMLEAGSMPSALLDESDGEVRVSAENISELESLMGQLSVNCDKLKTEYLYFWSPVGLQDEQDLAYAYVYTYYKLLSENAGGLILSTERLDTSMSLRLLFESMKYIDTQMGLDKNGDVLSAFGQSDWSSFIPRLKLDELDERTVFVNENYKNTPMPVVGSYVLWNAQQGRGVYDWYSGKDALSVERITEIDRVLSVNMVPSPEQKGYSALVYTFSLKEVISAVDMFSFDIWIDGERGEEYELVFELCGKSASSEVVARIRSGVRITVYLATEEIGRSDAVGNLRVIAKPINGDAPYSLRLMKLSAHSSKMNDERLAKEITDIRLESLDNAKAQKQEPLISWQGGVVLVVFLLFVGTVVVVTLARKSE